MIGAALAVGISDAVVDALGIVPAVKLVPMARLVRINRAAFGNLFVQLWVNAQETALGTTSGPDASSCGYAKATPAFPDRRWLDYHPWNQKT